MWILFYYFVDIMLVVGWGDVCVLFMEGRFMCDMVYVLVFDGFVDW